MLSDRVASGAIRPAGDHIHDALVQHALLPKEERFFDLFAQHSKVLVAGADALRTMLDGGEAVTKNYQLVMDREHDADVITRDIFIAVSAASSPRLIAAR